MLPSAGAGLRPRMTPRSSGTTSPVGRRRPPSAGRCTRRGSCGATRWWHTRHDGAAGGVRCPSGQLTASTVDEVPWERWAGRKVVSPSWSSSSTPGRSSTRGVAGRMVVWVPSSIRSLNVGSGSEVSCSDPVSSAASTAATYAGARRRAVRSRRRQDAVRDAVDEGGGHRRRLHRAGLDHGGHLGRERLELDPAGGDDATHEAAWADERVGASACVEGEDAPGTGEAHVSGPARQRRRGTGGEVDESECGRVAVEGLLHDRQHAFHDGGAGGRGHGERLPELVDDLLVVGVGEKDPVGATAEEHPRATDVPGFHDHRRLPSFTPTPPSSPITPVPRSRPDLSEPRLDTYPPCGGPAVGAGNRGGYSWHGGGS